MSSTGTPLALNLAAEGEPSPLMPHLSELIVGLVAFTLLFLFLRAKVWPMFEKAYAERRDAIEGGMERARKAEEEAQEALERYRAQLADARHEAARLREDAREQGAEILAQMREQAQAEAKRITDNARQQIEADKQQAINQLRSTVGTLATDLAGRIVGESLADDDRRSRVVDRFLDELEARADAGNGADGGSREPAPAGAGSSRRAGSGSKGGKGRTGSAGGTDGGSAEG